MHLDRRVLMYNFKNCISPYLFNLYSFLVFLSVTIVKIFVYILNIWIPSHAQIGITTMSSDDAPPSPVVISNLLTSAVFAISTGRTAEDVSATFSRFYNNGEIQLAQEKLISVGCKLARRSSRNENSLKEKHIGEIMNALSLLDWKSKNITFAADDLSRICHVPTNLDDEIQLRTEMETMKKRFQDLEELCKSMIGEMQNLNEKVSNCSTDFRSTTGIMLQQMQKSTDPQIVPLANPSVSMITKPWQNPERSRDFFKPRVPPPTTFSSTPLSPSDRRLHPLFREPGEILAKAKHDDWETARPRKKKQMIVGKGQQSSIKAVKPIRTSSIFLTRCDSGTQESEVKKYLEDENSWDCTVTKLNTRQNTYASFRVDITFTDKNPQEFLNPDCWPPETYIRKYHRERNTGPHGRVSSATPK